MGIWHSSSKSSIKARVDSSSSLQRQQQLLRNAQSGLLQLYPPDAGTTTVETVWTKIARAAIPGTTTVSSSSLSHPISDDEDPGQDPDQSDYYSIHALKITTRRTDSSSSLSSTAPTARPSSSASSSAAAATTATTENKPEEPPLVLLHGYMNGAGYFYRNFAGLAQSFPTIYALDLLGWGLSSRPIWPVTTTTTAGHPPTSASSSFLTTATTGDGGSHPRLSHETPPEQDDDDNDPAVSASERFFVNSLEAWRQAHQIDQMILAGHSLGGYLAVAYAERYPHRVEQLILISPVGVPIESATVLQQRHVRRTTSRSYRFWYGWYEWIYRYCTPGDLLRHLPTALGRSRIQHYVQQRLPAIDRAVEQSLLADYLYYNATLPGSAEYCLPHLLTPSLFGKRPLVDRIPHLPIAACHFLYGDRDWMDATTGGLAVQQRCCHDRRRRRCPDDPPPPELLDHGRRAITTPPLPPPPIGHSPPPPRVTVHQVRKAGHLLMLDNPDEFNNAMALVAARTPVLVGSSLSIPKELVSERVPVVD